MSTSLAAMQGLGIAQFNLGTNPSSDSDLNELLRDEDMSYNRLSGIMRELRNGGFRMRAKAAQMLAQALYHVDVGNDIRVVLLNIPIFLRRFG